MPSVRGLTPTKLARTLGCPVSRLRVLARSRDSHYHQVRINLGGKQRTLTIPSAELMSLQRTLLKEIFYSVPSLDCLGHVRRRGVLWTLRRHQGDPYLLHVDIRAFFPSVTPERVEASLSSLQVAPEAAHLMARLVTWGGELPQGAPTSVAVGDIVLYPLDRRIRGLATTHGLTYTRYVDDIALSGQRWAIERFASQVRAWVEGDGWVLSEKGGLYGPDDSHQVLNAVVNRKPNVTRRYYESVRNQLRRIARFEHRPDPGEIDSLAAKVVWIATVNSNRHAPLLRLLREAMARDTLSANPDQAPVCS